MQRRASDQIDLTKVVDGKDGTSVTILGSYNTMAELETAHPTGNLGDAYMVSGDLVVWNGSAWENVGRIQGPQGPAGRGISNITEYYAINNSTTAPADSAFDTTVKTPTATNRYLWNYELITYTDSTSKKMDKHIVAVYGEQGQTGKGISSVTEYYAKNNSTTAPADSAFGTSVVTADSSNKYVWNYELITYTDNTTSKTSKRIIGMYGETGPQGGTGPAGSDGISVTSVQPQYYLSTSSSSATGGSWGTTITYVSGKYIWTRSKNSYSDGSVDYSTEIYNEALTQACQNALAALATAQAVNQYTWHTETDTGAGAGTHITAIPKDDFLADPDNGGYNTLFDNIGMKIRNGLRKLASYGVKAIIGEENNARIEIAPTRVAAYDNHNVLGFSVESGADSGNVQISEFAQPFANLGNNETAAYTLTETPVANTKIYVEIDSYAFNPTIESIEFTAGNYETKTVSGVTIANTVTVAYSATKVITITNNLNEVIYTGRVIYTANRANAVVNIPASLIVHETDITKALFSPTLISTGISAYQSRATLDSGGYFDIGKWRYVDMQITIDASSLGTHNTWALFDGFATPANYYAGLSAGRTSFGNSSDSVYMFYINGNGRLCVSTAGTALAQNTQLTITGWYLKA